MNVYISHDMSDRLLALAVKAMTLELGHSTLDPIELPTTAMPLVAGADLVVAIVSAHSPNVYYELGVATALRKEILLIARTSEDVMPRVAAFPCLFVGDDATEYEDDVKRAILRGLTMRNAHAHAHLRTMNLDVLVSDDFESKARDAVAKWFTDQGATVTREPTNQSAEVDLLVQQKHYGKIIVDLKIFAPQSKVSVDAVRQLSAYKSAFGADHALLLTTGSATRAAEEFALTADVILSSMDEFLSSGSLGDVLRPAIRKPGQT
jgi:nucleoside 2-deoxyribosyltransferase